MRIAHLLILTFWLPACVDHNSSPLPPSPEPWVSWERIELPYNLSIALPPGYQINHRYNPADSLVYGFTWAQFLSPDTALVCGSDDNLTYFTRALAGPRIDFAIASGQAGAVVIEQWYSTWSGTVYLQTEDRQLFRKVLWISIESLDRLPELTLMAQSMEYR